MQSRFSWIIRPLLAVGCAFLAPLPVFACPHHEPWVFRLAGALIPFGLVIPICLALLKGKAARKQVALNHKGMCLKEQGQLTEAKVNKAYWFVAVPFWLFFAAILEHLLTYIG